MHGESSSRVIINALRSRVRKFIVFPFWFGYDQQAVERRGGEKNATRGDEVRSRAGRGKGGQPQQGSGGGKGGSGGCRARRGKRGKEKRHPGRPPAPPSAPAPSARRAP